MVDFHARGRGLSQTVGHRQLGDAIERRAQLQLHSPMVLGERAEPVVGSDRGLDFGRLFGLELAVQPREQFLVIDHAGSPSI